ncbi:MAG: AraC family transcriptional regulator [Planctomycetota bacterium]
MPPLSPASDASTLWHVRGHGHETHAVGRRYWWSNTRVPAGGSVVQFTRAGRIDLHDGRGQHPVGPGTFLLFNYGDNTSYGQRRPLRETYVCQWASLFGAGVVEHLRALIHRHGPIHHVGLDHPLVEQHDRLIDMAGPESGIEPTELAGHIHHFVMGLYDVADLRFQAQRSPVQQAVQSILRRPHQPMSLKEIAAQFGVSREHLSRVFRQTVGRSAHDVLAEAKCQRALSLLEQTRLPIGEVARQAGYSSLHHLARHVHDATGIAPTAYRQRANAQPKNN